MADTPVPGDGDHDWLFDYMMSAFRSPSWEIPLMMFIDDNWSVPKIELAVCGWLNSNNFAAVSAAVSALPALTRAVSAFCAFQHPVRLG